MCEFVCQGVCLMLGDGGVGGYPCEPKRNLAHIDTHIHRGIAFSADLGNTLVYLLNYYNTFFPKKCVLSVAHGRLAVFGVLRASVS